MHPQVQQPKPGKCPICAMDLIPLSQAKSNLGAVRQLEMSVAAKQLARISTQPVKRQFVESEVRLVGKVALDETKTKTVAAYFPARIDRLYVDYTGVEVRKGDHLASVYSPELLTAQTELLSAIKFGSNIESAREKLRLWGLSESRIEAIEKKGKASDQLDIDSPLGGIVIQKHVNPGDYVKTGDPLFTIADLSEVWVMLDAYESDLPWLRFGQKVEFEAEAVPGRKFEGTIAFIAPMLDPKSRTVKVRVNADNPGQILKPEMFVRAQVWATLAGEGNVISPDLAGKWISPMHPEIVRDEPGDCPVCGMALVRVEDLGYTLPEGSEEAPLIVPTSAVLKTGKRSIVYVEVPDQEQPTYEGREVLLGPRAGGYYIIEEGLKEGEKVVTEGSFKIDSALQILARPSMMNPDEASEFTDGPDPVFEAPTEFRQSLGSVFGSYLEVQKALAADDPELAKEKAGAFGQQLQQVDMKLVEGEAHETWMGQLAALRGAADQIAGAKDIAAMRVAFEPLSNAMTKTVTSFQPLGMDHIYEVHCPMAFDFKGASWLQDKEDVLNPYFGSEMLTCGSVKREVLGTQSSEAGKHEH